MYTLDEYSFFVKFCFDKIRGGSELNSIYSILKPPCEKFQFHIQSHGKLTDPVLNLIELQKRLQSNPNARNSHYALMSASIAFSDLSFRQTNN